MSDEITAPEIELARDNLLGYCILAHEAYIPAEHLILITNELQKVERGETSRLMIFAPPRHGKSLTASKLFPSWYMGRHPKHDIIFTSYSQDIADDCGRGVQSYIESDIHKLCFPECKIDPGSNSVRRFHTTQGGAYFAAGIGGPITGRGGHLRMIDDPYKNREEADSESRNRIIREWYTSTFYTRGQVDFELLNSGQVSSAEYAPIVVMLTRWTGRGLEQHLLDIQAEQGDNLDPRLRWKIISLPALAEDDSDLLGRPYGRALWPEAFNERLLLQIQRDIGARDFNALYQQRPSDAEGDIFKREHWKLISELPTEYDLLIQSWDTSFKDTSTSDFVVGLLMGMKGPDIFVIDRVRARMNMFKCMDEIRNMSTKYPKAYKKVIENKANGPAIIAKLQSEITGIIAGNPDIVGNKQQRWNAAAPCVESGNVYLPKNAPWTDEFVEELATVPNGKYDDQADAFAQGVLTLLGDRNAGIIEYYQKKFDALMAAKTSQEQKKMNSTRGWS